MSICDRTERETERVVYEKSEYSGQGAGCPRKRIAIAESLIYHIGFNSTMA
jgi:hypothetical protein